MSDKEKSKLLLEGMGDMIEGLSKQGKLPRGAKKMLGDLDIMKNSEKFMKNPELLQKLQTERK
ncbi:hypothetical protein ACFL35_13340 [Candidatus Riflebacteria bacterium]